MRGVLKNCRSGFIIRVPCCIVYKFDIIKNKSEHVFTGKKRLLGTLMPDDEKRQKCVCELQVKNFCWILE